MNKLSYEEKKLELTTINEEASYYTPVQGKQIKLLRKRVPLHLLSLDTKNQRIQHTFKSEGLESTDDAIENRLWKEEYVKSLGQSIELNGGLINPLLITSDGVVVEGNSRLAALRRTSNKIEIRGEEVPDFIKVPMCEVLPDNIDRTHLCWLLAEFHIAGKNPWHAYEQAEAIYTLHHDENQSIDKIAEHLRKPRNIIQRKIDSYHLMSEYLEKFPGTKQLDKWSYFEEFYKKNELRARIEPNNSNFEPNFKDTLFSWINEGKLKGEQMRRLHQVLEIPEAVKSLEDEGFESAFEKVIEKKPEEGLKIFKIISNLIEEIESLPISYIDDLKEAEAHDERIRLVSQLSKKMITLLSMTGNANLNSEDEVASGRN